MCPLQHRFDSAITSPTPLGTFTWISAVSLGRLAVSLGRRCTQNAGIWREHCNLCVLLAKCREPSTSHGLAAFSASLLESPAPYLITCPVHWGMTNPPTKGCAIENGGSQQVCSISFSVLQTPKFSQFGLKRRFPGKQHYRCASAHNIQLWIPVCQLNLILPKLQLQHLAQSHLLWARCSSLTWGLQGPPGSGQLHLQVSEVRMLMSAWPVCGGGGCLRPWKASSHPQPQTLAPLAWCQMQ